MTPATPVVGTHERTRLRHGPIDLLIQAWGAPSHIAAALAAARAAFPAILPTLCTELTDLRTELPSPAPHGPVAQAMHAAVAPYAAHRITPMAAVAGAVADHVLAAMTAAAPLAKAYVNNGGDIAFHLAPAETLRCGLITTLAAPSLDGAFLLHAAAPSRGIATSGRACKGQGGRSFSFGIADSVTILARTAAMADAAASIVGNAVDLPAHPGIDRRPAAGIDPDSDLGARLITWHVPRLAPHDVRRALAAGRRVADDLRRAGLIDGAVLALQGQLAACLDAELDAA